MKLLLFILLLSVQPDPSKRILDIYTSNKLDKKYREQLMVLSTDPPGLNERNIFIKEHFKSAGFKIKLTGKDGGEKYSSSSVLTIKKLYAIIDAMPMRKAEVKKL